MFKLIALRKSEDSLKNLRSRYCLIILYLIVIRSENSELLQAEENKLAEDAKAAMADRIKPLPSTDGLDDEQLKQLC